MPIDRQIRYAVGVGYQLTERLNVVGVFEYVDLGDAKISSSTLRGHYEDNRIIAFALHASYRF